ncbi:hypothetical protein FQA39_LY03514 [Lamprigera yunnana]|nr:hypothetical protein FQA39_LY03514 [Lamprigera yunnana]
MITETLRRKQQEIGKNGKGMFCKLCTVDARYSQTNYSATTKLSINENRRHEFCPSGADSWCKWQKDTAIGGDPEIREHSTLLQLDVQKYNLGMICYQDAWALACRMQTKA